jgi:hypothetical protein
MQTATGPEKSRAVVFYSILHIIYAKEILILLIKLSGHLINNRHKRTLATGADNGRHKQKI